jgi:hypothetical protein
VQKIAGLADETLTKRSDFPARASREPLQADHEARVSSVPAPSRGTKRGHVAAMSGCLLVELGLTIYVCG